jgi:5,10-methylenetetrahydrofolate reductase
MSSLACAHFVLEENAEPIMQMTSRDRNRIMFQSDLYGAYALGVRKVLFIRGDDPILGTHPNAKGVYDLDTTQAISLAVRLERGTDLAGDELEGSPSFFVGSTFNPFKEPQHEELAKIERKRDAGAQFFQTQAVFDIDRFQRFMENVQEAGIRTLAGIIPLRSPEIAEFMDGNVEGIHIPQEYIARLKEAGAGLDETDASKAYEEEGLEIALELIEAVKRVQGVCGIHIMGVAWTESVPQIVRAAGLYPRPKRGK